MAYIVNNTRGQIIAVIQDGTINTTATTQTLIGKNVTPYGEYNVENIVHQLENFANTTPPLNPIEGQTWYNITDQQLYTYSGADWKPTSGVTVAVEAPDLDPQVGDVWFNPTNQQTKIYGATTTGLGWLPIGKVTVATSQPTGVVSGELYFNTSSKQLFAFDGQFWNLVGPEGVAGYATTRCVSTTLPDLALTQYPVILCYSGGTVQSIISSYAFTIAVNNRPTGFVSLVPGINLAAGSVLSGRATFADQLTTPRLINETPFDGTQNIQVGTYGNLTPGAYLTGNVWNGLTNTTFSVNASTANSINNIVARNAFGDFAANTIYARLVGNVEGLATNVTSVVTPSHGGTGQATYDLGDILVGNQTGGLERGRLVGSNYINIQTGTDGRTITFTYTGGAGNGTVTSVGIVNGEGIGVSGSPVTGAGNITVTNTGVTRLNAGPGLSVDRVNGNVTVTNTGVTQLNAGSGISLSGTAGNITITSTATPGVTGVTKIIPGQNVTISPGSGTGEVTINATGGGGGGGGATVSYAGEIMMWAGSVVPAGWANCDGAAVSRTTYSTLFSRIGTTYGAGDGSTTFNLPDMRGKLGIGASSSLSRNVEGYLDIASYPIIDFTNPNSYQTYTPVGSTDVTRPNRNEVSVDLYSRFGGPSWPNSVSPLPAPPNGDVYVCVFGYPEGYNALELYDRICETTQTVDVTGVNTVTYYVNKGTDTTWGEDPDSGENLLLQYSLYMGGVEANWVTLDTVRPTDVANGTWVLRTVTLPGAITSNPTHVKFRWFQTGDHTAGTTDPRKCVDTWAFTGLRSDGPLATPTFETNRLAVAGATGGNRSAIAYLSNFWIIKLIDTSGGSGGTGNQYVQTSPPGSPTIADLWYDSGNTGRLYVWTGLQWVDASPGVEPPGGSPAPYILPTASASTLGGVKVDNSTIVINGNGVISAPAANFSDRSLTPEGYQAFPGGLIWQWGSYRTTTVDGSVNVTFSKTFTTLLHTYVSMEYVQGNGGPETVAQTKNPTNTGMTLSWGRVAGSSGGSDPSDLTIIHWMAIGK